MKPITCGLRFNRLLWAFLLLGCLTACSSRTNGPGYVSWIEDPAHGLHPKTIHGELQFTLHHQPIDYLILQELRDFNAQTSQFVEARKDREGLEYYRLEIASTQPGTSVLAVGMFGSDKKVEREQYLSFMAGEDIFLKIGDQKLSTALYHYEGDFGIRPHINLIFAFERQPDDLDRQIIFRDRQLTGQEIKFDLSAQTMQNIPEYKL